MKLPKAGPERPSLHPDAPRGDLHANFHPGFHSGLWCKRMHLARAPACRWTAREEQVAKSLPGPGDYNAQLDMPKPARRTADAVGVCVCAIAFRFLWWLV